MELYNQVLSNSFDAIFTLDHDLFVTEWNASLAYLLGIKKADAMGKLIFDLVPSLKEECEYYFSEAVLKEGRLIEILFQEFLTPKSQSKTFVKAKYFQHGDGGLMGIWRQLPSYDQAERDYLNLLKSVIVNTNDAILVTKAQPIDAPNGPTIIYMNPAFTKMTGYSEKEMLGLTPRAMQGDRTDNDATSEIREALKAWKPINKEILNYSKEGREFWVDLDIVPVANEEGFYTHWIAIQRETTEKKLNEEKLKLLNTQLETRVKERTIALEKFIHFIAHDIKQPLRTINGLLHQLNHSSGLNSDQVKQTNDAMDTAQTVYKMIDGLMGFTKARNTTIRTEKINFQIIIEKAMNNLAFLITEKSAAVEVSEMPDVKIDSSLMINVIQNLISNAIKYCDKEIPQINISSQLEGPFFIISVNDNGIGMLQSKLDEIFNIFERIKTNLSTNGSGLGLSICRSIVEKHGGKIQVESLKGKGSTFHIYLPAIDE